MDDSEDPNKLASTLHEPPTAAAATQPLLQKPYPTFEPAITSASEPEEDQTQYLQISYNYGPRSIKDIPFLVLFCLLVLCTFGFGIFASVHRNPHRSQVSSFIYNTTSSSCTFVKDIRSPFSSNSSRWSLFYESLSDSSTSYGRPTFLNNSNSSPLDGLHGNYSFSTHLTSLNSSKSSLSKGTSENSSYPDNSVPLDSPKSTFLSGLIDYASLLGNPASLKSRKSSLVKSLIWTLVITLIVSVPFVLLVLLFLKHYTKQLVYASLPFFVIVPIFINVYWFVACALSSRCSDAFPLGYRIVVLIFVFLVIAVIVWIFVSNWHRIELTVRIIGVASNALWSNLGLFGVLPALTLGLFVYYVPIVVFLIFAIRNGKIVPKEEHGEYHCVWKQDGWVPAYYTLAILTMLWSATVMIEGQVYVISGTIAQWYFSKNDLGPKHGIRSSLRNAFGPSSGTICFSGLLICVVRVVRSVVDNARREDASGIVNLILRCCANALLSAFDFLNKFTINFTAITGEAYCSAARMTYELLKRNLLSTVFVEVVSTRILAGIVLVLSAIYAIVVCVLLKAAVHLGDDAYFVALMAWILLIVILGFFAHVLDNVIETVYVCYAIDRDRGEVYKQDVHEVYVHLPISRSHRAGFVSRTPLVV
ncbi:Choline transporter-like protein [Handroanthus impetiginosus]|uniref:Choline transporter-like protein n=1 Tax=Handroanthus impetiginosus TaxID=429701 RepID=A0A2G9HPF6_9LAMI|nr:Choline transporter-like protein [Handroanthus impetiginosus]